MTSIDSYIANISLYAINRPKLNFGGYLAFESTFQALKQDKFANYLMKIESFDKYFCLLFTSACGKFGPQLLTLHLPFYISYGEKGQLCLLFEQIASFDR